MYHFDLLRSKCHAKLYNIPKIERRTRFYDTAAVYENPVAFVNYTDRRLSVIKKLTVFCLDRIIANRKKFFQSLV